MIVAQMVAKKSTSPTSSAGGKDNKRGVSFLADLALQRAIFALKATQMPPGDTLIITGDTSIISPDVKRIIDSLLAANERSDLSQANPTDGPRYLFSEWQMFLIVVLIIASLYLWHVGLPDIFRKWRNERKARQLFNNMIVYDNWLRKFNPYYLSLDTEGKNRFIERTIRFMLSKKFRFHKLRADEKTCFLISAAAVQLTYGLKNYRMDFFKYIHVLSNVYQIKKDDSVYLGHVSPKGIHIAWNHFLNGFEDYTDAVNVGLHEMAHAITFDLFLGYQNRHDARLKERMESFMEEGKKVFRGMKANASHVLYDYAANNFDEFWAVSIETFFEKSSYLQSNLPDLYQAICEVLNQNPLTEHKIINDQIAGV
jgi:MtfA peptidase